MERITHREMRNRSGEILRRVAGGESIEITNSGRVAAVIVPATPSALDDLIERGEVRPAQGDLKELLAIKRERASRPSSEILADVRGRW